MVFDLIPNLFASLISILFPVFASYKALRTSDPAQLAPWLMYWVSFALLTAVETNFSLLLMFVPFYSVLRLLFLLYLVLPQTQGARIIYQTHIHPFLAQREAQIEQVMSDAHAHLKASGLDYVTDAIAWIQRVLLRQPIPDPRPASSGTETFAAALLARFNLPSAREGFAAPAGDFYGMLAAAASTLSKGVASAAAGGGAGTAGGSADARVEQLAPAASLVPRHITDPREKTRFLAQQREQLRLVLGALDRQQLELEKSGGGGGGGAREDGRALPAKDDKAMSRTKSEVSFERIDRDEVSGAVAAKDAGGGGWFEWLAGQGKAGKEAERTPSSDAQGKARSSGVDTS